MKQFLDWLDHRSGYRRLLHEALYENIPGGAKWRYVWGSTLVFAFTVQVITGVFLWLAYSPSATTAWESVYYIQCEMQGGWLLRGLHHFTAHAMVVLLALHLMQVVIDGAYKAPREINFWLGLVLMQIVLGLSLTGYLLPWDQKGYWATRVATNLMALAPVVGEDLQKLVVGGDEYGHLTLTRFFALHAGVLPGLLVLILVLHVGLFRRHGITAHKPTARPDQKFWPDQVLRDGVACLAMLAVVLFLVVRPMLFGEHPSAAPRGDYLGAELGPPADPANEYSAARPEWYFLFLFQFLKVFEGQGEIGEFIGAIVAPGAVMLLLFLMPFIGRWKLGHGFNIGLVIALLVGVGALTAQAINEDRHNESYVAAVEQSEKDAARAKQIARSRDMIPVEGASWAMRNDPRRLFERKCASCHSWVDEKGQGIKPETPSAPNLYGFASRRWIKGLLDPQQIVGPHYFGATKHKKGEMIGFVTSKEEDNLQDAMKWKPEQIENVVKALSAEARLPSQRDADEADATRIDAGQKLIANEERCAQCHKFHKAEGGEAPDLTGYGSPEWLAEFVSNPAAKRFYGASNDRMPAFCLAPHFPERNELSPRQLRLILEWLRGEWE